MKSIPFLTGLALVFTLASSCRKDAEQPTQTTPQAQNGTVIYRIDNQYRQFAATYSSQTNMLTTQNSQERLELRFMPNQTVQNVTTGFIPSIGVVNLSNTNINFYSNNCSPTGGSITVTNIDQTTISGTFQGRMCTTNGEVKIIDQGVFTRIPAQ